MQSALILRPNDAAVRFDDILTDVETKSAALSIAASLISPVELLEQMGQFCRRHADTVITESDCQAVILLFLQRDFHDQRLRMGVFETVLHKVIEDAFHLLLVDIEETVPLTNALELQTSLFCD